VKFVLYFDLGGRKTADIATGREAVGSIGDDRLVSPVRHAERCTNLPQEEKGQ